MSQRRGKKVKKKCPTCTREYDVIEYYGIDPLDIPISEYHVRCRKCLWPVAMSIVSDDGLCELCTMELREGSQCLHNEKN